MVIKMKGVLINAKSKKFEVIEKNFLPIEWGFYWHEKFETYKLDPYHPNNVFTMSSGVLPIVGGHRLVFTFKSPLWDGFYFSTLGGAGYQFKKTGLTHLAIVGKAEKPSLVVIDNGNIELFEVKEEFSSVYELTDYIVKNFKDKNLRSVVVGEASKKTSMGALFSQTIRGGKRVEGSEDWAARGGGGSVLYRAHNILGIVFYGDKEEELEEEAKKIIENYYKEKFIKVVIEHTKKYRFDEKTGTGGTFGNNWILYKEKVPIFNWRMPYISKEEREKILKVIFKNYLEVFNKEAIETKNWANCGEPCPVVCKKYRNKNKVDYEPYAANGTLLGIFDLYEVDKVMKKVDSLGFDAIEIGNLMAWIFELLDVGLLKEEDLGIKKPIFNYKIVAEGDLEKIKEMSEHNSEQALTFIDNLIKQELEIYKILALGKRKAGKILNEKFKYRVKEKKFNDYAVYVAKGSWGEIGSNLYWTPGFFIPLPIHGKYLTYYKPEFLEPEKLAELIVDSIKLEMTIENLGMCRFHRRWVKPVLKELGKKILGREDIERDSIELYRKIAEFNKKTGEPEKIESERVKDLIVGLAKEYDNKEWIEKFKDKEMVNEYIKRVLDKYSELLNVDWRLRV